MLFKWNIAKKLIQLRVFHEAIMIKLNLSQKFEYFEEKKQKKKQINLFSEIQKYQQQQKSVNLLNYILKTVLKIWRMATN